MCVSPFPCNLSELRQHAERGEDIAQDAFARHHYHGHGVPLDHAEAARWYQRAAARGNPTAQFNLAHMYACGDGVCQNRNTAYWWYWRAAKQGHARAIRTLEQLPPRRPPGRRRRAAGKENTPHAE